MEGILPALESAHAIAEVTRRAPGMGEDQIMLVNLSGRGDKDVESVLEYDAASAPGNPGGATRAPFQAPGARMGLESRHTRTSPGARHRATGGTAGVSPASGSGATK